MLEFMYDRILTGSEFDHYPTQYIHKYTELIHVYWVRERILAGL